LETNLANNIDQIATKGSDILGQIETETTALVDRMTTDTVAQIKKTQETVITGIEGQLNAITHGIQGYGDTFNNKVKEIRIMIENLSESLTEIDQKAEKIPPYQLDTQPLFGLETVRNFIESMFDRLAAGITLLTPSFKWLPLEKIEKSKMSQRITIVVPVEETKKTDMVKTLLKKNNVRIKSVSIEGMKMDYLAADRDGEEFCLGVTGGSDEKVIGLATTNDSYITLFGKIVIGDYFLARSKDLQRADYGL
jgi:hypothetical protein